MVRAAPPSITGAIALHGAPHQSPEAWMMYQHRTSSHYHCSADVWLLGWHWPGRMGPGGPSKVLFIILNANKYYGYP